MIGLRALFQVTDVMSYSHMAEGCGELCGICFIGALVLFMSASASWPKEAPKVALIDCVAPGIRLAAHEFWEATSNHTITERDRALQTPGF